MRYLLTLLILLNFCAEAQTTNHVPNPGFETHNYCPTQLDSLAVCSPPWYSYTNGTPDYYNTCGSNNAGIPSNALGYQQSFGNGYAGLLLYSIAQPDNKEYMAVGITPLKPGHTYEVAMSISLSNGSMWGLNGFGFYFLDKAKGTVSTQATLSVTPQVSFATTYAIVTDTQNWRRLSTTWVADSTYDTLVIGAFLPSGSQTLHYAGSASSQQFRSYYYIDSVVVRPFVEFTTGTAYCTGDTITVPFTALSSYYTPGNTFTLQLSGPTGSFANPTSLGSVTTTNSGSITGVIPASASGTGYRIRIVPSSPANTSGDNGADITITQRPTVVASSNSPICGGSTLNINATNSSGSSVSWAGPASFSSIQANNAITNAAVSNSGDYIVTASLNGCTARDTVTVQVKLMPAVPTATSNSPVCSGNDLNLTATSITSGVSYNWTGPSFTSIQQNPVRANSTTSMSGTYSVTATLNGCTSAAGTVNATVNQTPATPTAASNSPVCAGGVLNLTANSTTSGVTYNWTGPGGFASGQQYPSISPVSVNEAGAYSVTAELNGCSSAGSGNTNVVVNNVSSLGIYPSPNDTLCVNKPNATFVAVPFNAGVGPQYQWYKNNNPIAGATNISYPATGIADEDSVYCRMTVTGVCADPLILYSNKIGMTVLPMTQGPGITITADPGTTLSPWQLVKFSATVANAGAKPRYQWKRNGADVLGANSDNWSAYNLSDGDMVSCIVTSSVWCADPESIESNKLAVNIKTGIEDAGRRNHMQLYPNPNSGNFNVYIPLFEGGIGVEVVNAVGQVVYSRQFAAGSRQLGIALPGSIANGAYLLRVRTEDGVRVMRFTVSR